MKTCCIEKCLKRIYFFVDWFFHPVRFWGHCQNIASFFFQGSGSSSAPPPDRFREDDDDDDDVLQRPH